MPKYTVTFFSPDGLVSRVQEVEAADDDAILDLVGDSEHRHAIQVRQDERQVGRFAPQHRPWGRP